MDDDCQVLVEENNHQQSVQTDEDDDPLIAEVGKQISKAGKR
jgi:hypothetical protein